MDNELENKVYFAMDAVQFGRIVAYIKEDRKYEYRFAHDTPGALTDYLNREYEKTARWVVRIAQYGYEVTDKQNNDSKWDFHSGEAIAAFLEGAFYSL